MLEITRSPFPSRPVWATPLCASKSQFSRNAVAMRHGRPALSTTTDTRSSTAGLPMVAPTSRHALRISAPLRPRHASTAPCRSLSTLKMNDIDDGARLPYFCDCLSFYTQWRCPPFFKLSRMRLFTTVTLGRYGSLRVAVFLSGRVPQRELKSQPCSRHLWVNSSGAPVQRSSAAVGLGLASRSSTKPRCEASLGSAITHKGPILTSRTV